MAPFKKIAPPIEMNKVVDKRHNFFMIDNPIVDNDDINLYMREVYCVLSRFARDNQCFPSLQTICSKIRNRNGKPVSKNTVIQAIKDLKARNYVNVVNRKDRDGFITNYYVLLPVISKTQRETEAEIFALQEELNPSLPLHFSAAEKRSEPPAPCTTPLFTPCTTLVHQEDNTRKTNITIQESVKTATKEVAHTQKQMSLPEGMKKKAMNIIEKWNSKPSVIRQLSSQDSRLVFQIMAKLKSGITEEEVMKAIDNYETVISNQDKFFYSVKFTLGGFIHKGLQRFLDSAKPIECLVKFKRKAKPVTEICHDWTEEIRKYGTPEQKLEFGII